MPVNVRCIASFCNNTQVLSLGNISHPLARTCMNALQTPRKAKPGSEEHKKK